MPQIYTGEKKIWCDPESSLIKNSVKEAKVYKSRRMCTAVPFNGRTPERIQMPNKQENRGTNSGIFLKGRYHTAVKSNELELYASAWINLRN